MAQEKPAAVTPRPALNQTSTRSVAMPAMMPTVVSLMVTARTDVQADAGHAVVAAIVAASVTMPAPIPAVAMPIAPPVYFGSRGVHGRCRLQNAEACGWCRTGRTCDQRGQARCCHADEHSPRHRPSPSHFHTVERPDGQTHARWIGSGESSDRERYKRVSCAGSGCFSMPAALAGRWCRG